MRELYSPKEHLYYTKLAHSQKFRKWFKDRYKVNLSTLNTSEAFDEKMNVVKRKMSLRYMWAIYFNVVKGK